MDTKEVIERAKVIHKEFILQKTVDILEDNISEGSEKYVINIEEKNDHGMGIAKNKCETISFVRDKATLLNERRKVTKPLLRSLFKTIRSTS